MTVQTNTNVASFLGNGAATYPIGFKFNSAADLVVQKTVIATGVTTTLTLNSDYSVAGAGVEEGGSITFSQAPTSAESIKVTRVVDLLQLTDLRNQGKFYAEVHEEVFDKLVMIDQQQQTEIVDANAKSDEAVITANAANAKSDQAVAKAAQNLVDMQAQYDAFEQGAAFVVIGDYAADLIVNGYNKVFRKDGEFYRAKAELTLPYTLNGDWAAESASFVSVGDAVLRQGLAGESGAGLVGYGEGTVEEELQRAAAASAYQELDIVSGAIALDLSAARAFGVELSANISAIDLSGAIPGQRTVAHIYFKQPDNEDGKSVTLPSSIMAPYGVLAEVDTSRAATTMLRLVSVDGGGTWLLDDRQVYFGVAMYQLPQLATEHATFSDEGDSTSGWTSSNATITSSGSYLRQTKQAAGSNSSMTKPISFTPVSSDFILYGKVRAKHDASATAVIWLLNGSKEISIWFGSNNATDVAAQGAISICGTTGASARNVVQVASGYNYESTPIEFALQFDQKFSTLTCWFREADGRWKFRGRVACDWFSSADIQVLTTTSSAAGAWVEFDYLMLARPNLAVLSDSIGEGKTLFSPNPSLGLTNDESTWMRHAPIYPNLRNNLIVNKGVGGQSSAQILARVTDVTSTGARVVFLHASSNDEALSVTQAARTENIQSTVSAITATGGQVVLLNAMYGTSAGGDNTPTPDLRDYMRTWWNGGRLSVSGAAAVFDIMEPLRVSGDYMNAALTQPDGIHPNVDGHSAIGAYIASFQ